MMGGNTRNMQSCVQKYNKLNKSHLVGQLLNSIHNARTHVYKTHMQVTHSKVFTSILFCSQLSLKISTLNDTKTDFPVVLLMQLGIKFTPKEVH